MYRYDDDFYSYISADSVESARVVIPLVKKVLPRPISSVLDVGCGAGAWLSVWKEQGIQIKGIDGEYVNRDMLLIPPDAFVEKDLREAFTLPDQYDLVQCLEVAEHLPKSSASQLVDSLCRHSDLVVFSAAPPGQGGENHINEQSYSYWRDLFEINDYQMYDCLRPSLIDQSKVMPWYRYNTFVYVNRECLADVHDTLGDTAVDQGFPPKDVSPVLYKFRKLIIYKLPIKLQTLLAKIKKLFKNTLSI